MLNRLRRFIGRFINKTSTVNNEPLNKVSLIVIILIDIVILTNVFAGLSDISQWYIDPIAASPCYSEWNSYRTNQSPDRDFQAARSALSLNRTYESSFRQRYQQAETGHLGKVTETCLTYADYKDKVYTADNQAKLKTIDQKQTSIVKLEEANSTIRSQYDSTLLEKIAGQPREQSINAVGAEKAKQELDQNNLKITALKQEIATLKQTLLAKPNVASFLSFLKDAASFSQVESAFKSASFWYPSIQLIFQAVFLLPLIAIALFVHNMAQHRGYGLIALMSWHLLVIFLIPLVLKVFEFLQIGVLFQFIFDIIRVLLGGLLFLVSYVYILLIPVIGFGIIKFFQRIVFNPKLQAAGRVQKSRCIRCAKRLQPTDTHCPHCGYGQYVECHACHNLTHKLLPYCRECGTPQGGREGGGE